MRFSICSGNHGNSTSITDTVTWLQRALQECGHRADINFGIEPRAVNILIEHFVDEKTLRDLLEGRRRGTRYVLIATEPIVGGVFLTLARAGLPGPLTHALIRALSHEVDFQRDIQPGDRIAVAFERLRALAREHFATEAALLAERGHADLDDHAAECEEFDYLVDEIVTTDNFSRLELQRFLALWCLGHISGAAPLAAAA